MKEKHYTLTRGEMSIMQVLWDMPTGGTIHEIIERYPSPNAATEPELDSAEGAFSQTESTVSHPENAAPQAGDVQKPAYTTVATFLKILTNKGFVTSRRGETGKARIFSCVITRAMYSKQMMQEMKRGLFGGSIRRMVNFFVQEEELSFEELRELLEYIEEDQEKMKV